MRTGRATPRAARPHQGRLLRRRDAAQAARHDRRARGAPADDPALRQVARSRRSRRRSWSPTSASRRTTTATLIRLDDPRAHRGAPQGAREGGARDRRGGPRRDPQHPPRRACTTCASCKTAATSAADDEHRAEAELQKLTDEQGRRARRAAEGQGGRDPRGLSARWRPPTLTKRRCARSLRRHHHGRQRPLGRAARPVA